MFENASWIWPAGLKGPDCYAEFIADFETSDSDGVSAAISADSNYALYINGVFADSGQYADFPHHKVYDEIDISRFVKAGKNRIAVIVWYYGVPSFTYYIGRPGLIFEVHRGGQTVLSSGRNVLCRQSKRYISGRCEYITGQLGMTFHADLTHDEEWMKTGEEGFSPSAVCEGMPERLYPREIKKLVLEDPRPAKIVAQGTFTYKDPGERVGFLMKHAALSFLDKYEMQKDGVLASGLAPDSGDGIFFIVDMEKETAGYLDFELEVPEECDMEIGWGEHLLDGRCRTGIAERSFSASVRLAPGLNSYMNPFRRLGCRYVQFFVHTDRVKIVRAGVRTCDYPVKKKPFNTDNLLHREIYEVCCNTLIKCMHEHYEDCPWREQSYYALDSRNQMLCGYYAFEGYEFPRAGLRLIAQSIREDGHLPMCFPTNERLTIPSFTLAYIISLGEYLNHTKDVETIRHCFDAAKTIIDTFTGRIDETGLIPNFDETQKYWNFYEWQPYLNGRGNEGTVYDMCLNAMLSLALGSYGELCAAVGQDAEQCAIIRKKLNEKIAESFYDDETEQFLICIGQKRDCHSVLANALGVLCGAADGLKKEKLLETILINGAANGDTEVIPATLSMHTFRYDALLRADREKYKKAIIDEIDSVYLRMLRSGATTFWETEKGEADFSGAGSLCHGWSAMPIYYYHTLEEE